MKHESGHNLKIRYDWISLTGEDFEMRDIETGLFKDWNVLLIEGEEATPVEVIDPKASAVKKVAVKPSSKNAVEEVLDDRPRIIQYKRDFAAENND